MKGSILCLFAALILFGAGFSAYAFRAPGAAPACCNPQQNCCPKESCCSGGQHCPMHMHQS